MRNALPLHPTLSHPHTGLPLEAVGVIDGRVIWPILGAAENDGGGEGGDGGDGTGGQSGENGGGNGNGQESGGHNSSGGNGQGSNSSGSGATEGKVEDLPEWAQKQIRDARKEAGNHRTAKNALEQKQTELLDTIARGLGLKKDETPDPAKLAEQLSASQAAQKNAAIELAVYKIAGKKDVGGDPDALLDSNSFLAKVRELDHTAKDFADKVSAAVKDAVKANPKLAAAQAAGASSVDHSGGSGERGRSDQPKSLADAVASAYGT